MEDIANMSSDAIASRIQKTFAEKRGSLAETLTDQLKQNAETPEGEALNEALGTMVGGLAQHGAPGEQGHGGHQQVPVLTEQQIKRLTGKTDVGKMSLKERLKEQKESRKAMAQLRVKPDPIKVAHLTTARKIKIITISNKNFEQDISRLLHENYDNITVSTLETPPGYSGEVNCYYVPRGTGKSNSYLTKICPFFSTQKGVSEVVFHWRSENLSDEISLGFMESLKSSSVL